MLNDLRNEKLKFNLIHIIKSIGKYDNENLLDMLKGLSHTDKFFETIDDIPIEFLKAFDTLKTLNKDKSKFSKNDLTKKMFSPVFKLDDFILYQNYDYDTLELENIYKIKVNKGKKSKVDSEKYILLHLETEFNVFDMIQKIIKLDSFLFVCTAKNIEVNKIFKSYNILKFKDVKMNDLIEKTSFKLTVSYLVALFRKDFKTLALFSMFETLIDGISLILEKSLIKSQSKDDRYIKLVSKEDVEYILNNNHYIELSKHFDAFVKDFIELNDVLYSNFERARESKLNSFKSSIENIAELLVNAEIK